MNFLVHIYIRSKFNPKESLYIFKRNSTYINNCQKSKGPNITDFSLLQSSIDESVSKLYGFGPGYFINTGNSIVNLSYAFWKINEEYFDLNN